MSNEKTNLPKQILQYGIFSSITKSVPFLILPIITRRFSTEDIGLVDAVELQAALIAVVIELSLSSAIARFYFEAKKNGDLKEFLSTILLTILIVGSGGVMLTWTFSSSISLLLLDSPAMYGYILYGAVFGFLIPILGCSDIILRMEREVLKFNLANLIQALTYTGVIFWLVIKKSSNIEGLLIAMMFMYIAKLVLHGWWLRSKFGIQYSSKYLKKGLSYSLPLMPAVGISILNRQVDRMMIIHFYGLLALGIYAVAAKFILFIQLVAQAFRLAWEPYAISLIDSQDRDRVYKRSMNKYAWMMTLVGLSLVFVSPELMTIIAPKNYNEGLVIIPWVVGALIFHTSASITNIGVLISKKTYKNSIVTILGFGTNLVLTYFLLPNFGLQGAALGSFIASGIFTIGLCLQSYKEVDLRFDHSKLWGAILCYCLFSVVFISILNYVSHYYLGILMRALSLGALVLVLNLMFGLSEELRRAKKSSLEFLKKRV
ncbi:lipopolysaccharide biosynthesis protein [Reichenbachiella sp.]|uniref:lipopolysaccharide biosynthesis protein n=1 Tax=Reichenbachiella sp. TaxID=2184521 RepID=UPI003B5BD284